MNLSIRPLEAKEIPLIVDYFYQCREEDLERMGATPEKLPAPNKWVEDIEHQINLPDQEKKLFYLLWCIDD